MSLRNNRLPMIMVMGMTGSGKSYFINKVAGKQMVKEGASLSSCTQYCTISCVSVAGMGALVVDTPGFDDTVRSDADILNEIARLLIGQITLGFELKGMIYLHKITDNRYTQAAGNTFEIFKRICGTIAMENVMLVTSHWDHVDEQTGTSRERELQEKFWASMIEQGSQIRRYYGDIESARGIAAEVLLKKPVMLQLQDEMIHGNKILDKTAAGSYIDHNLIRKKTDIEIELKNLEEIYLQHGEGDELDWKTRTTELWDTERQRENLRSDIVGEAESETRTRRSTWLAGMGRIIIGSLTLAVNLVLLFAGLPTMDESMSV